MSELNVELYGRLVGTLTGERDRFDFHANAAGISEWGLLSTILSLAVPLADEPRPENAALRANFFEEILAEAKARERLSKKAKLDVDNTMGLLARYGRDVAGAVQIWNPDDPQEPRTPAFLPASPERVREMLEAVKSAPIGNVTSRHMSSLAGVPDKIVLAHSDGEWGEAVDGYGSTHIIKPVVGDLPSIIFDEEYGARIARHLGLATFMTRIERFAGVSALVIERYDRDDDRRLHQEDFNQALGLTGDEKYEVNGGVGLQTIARTLRENVGRRAAVDLLRMTTLSVAVGNLDMHAKNISLLHLPDGTMRLAPMYDVVPQMHQPFDKNFAFRINGKFAHADITKRDIVAEATGWGIREAASIVDNTLDQVASFAAQELPVPGSYFSLAEDISRFTANLINGRGASASPTVSRTDRSGTRRKDVGLGATENGGTSGSFTDKTQSPSDVSLSPLPESQGGWGGPVRR